MKVLAMGSDHAGFKLKEEINKFLSRESYTVKDFGAFSEASVDYTDYAHEVAKAVENGDCFRGILICGSGNGMCMTANKHKNIRAALCWNADVAALSRKHNDANIVCIPARFVSFELAVDIVKAFLSEEFEGGRHKVRIDKIECR